MSDDDDDDRPPRARRTDPWTSHAAADELTSAERHYRIILAALWVDEGTIYDLAKRTGLTHVQCARRLPELERFGLARPTDKVREGDTGRRCRIWRRETGDGNESRASEG